MKAQDAIVAMSLELNRLIYKKEYMLDYEVDLHELPSLEIKIEALSIILESAKVLHELVEDGEAIVKGSLLGVYYQDNTVHIPKELAEKLGIEVNDNE